MCKLRPKGRSKSLPPWPLLRRSRRSFIALSVGAGYSSGAHRRQLSEVVVLCYSFMYVPGALQVHREDHHIPRAEANRIRTV